MERGIISQRILAQWPRYAFLYGGMIAALLVIGFSASRGWFSFVLLGLVVFLVCAFFLVMNLWAVVKVYGRNGIRPHHALFDLGHIQSHDEIVYINLGSRQQPTSLSHRLTTGHITVVDVYNPQWITVKPPTRQPGNPVDDPRLTWIDGDIHLLPFPDGSVTNVMLCEILSPFWQHGDRLILLEEIHRILQPKGQLLIAEKCRTTNTWLVNGPAASQIPTQAYWEELISAAGFRIRKELNRDGLITCWRVSKPTLREARQLAFDLDY
ncbi:MAG: methyltransferase domain-containing protein [Chloroflexi bacterium]|nr:methyltransferase domain-containing protein [Chloroflexota bacterium]